MPHRLDDDELAARLADWSEYVRHENGDVELEQWAQVDALLDELARRLGLDVDVPYAPLGHPEFRPVPERARTFGHGR